MYDMRTKIIDAIADTEWQEHDTESLVDILIVKLKRQEKKIAELQQENALEKHALFQDRESFHREIKEIRNNPNLLLTTETYFCSRDLKRRYAVQINRGRVTLSEHVKNIGEIFQEISPREFADMI